MPANFILPPVTIIFTWPAPNYVDPVERTWLAPFAVVWLVISTILCFGRFYLRARKQAGTFGFDDSLIFVAWLFALGLTILACIGSSNGLGRHTWDIPYDNFPMLVQLGYFAQVFFLISMCTTKLSVLLFYRRMVKNVYSRKWLYILWAAITCNVSAGIATFIVYMVICRPLRAYWLAYQYLPIPYSEPYTCIPEGESLTLSSGIISVITDIYAVAIPYLMLRQYQLDVAPRQKIALNVIFALGWLATGCGIARTYYLYQMGKDTDLAWVGFNLLAWSLAETHIGIICACAPSLRAFFRKYVNLSSSRHSHRFSHIQDGGEGGSRGSRARCSNLPEIQLENKPDGSFVTSPTSPLPPIEKEEMMVNVSDTKASSTRTGDS